MRASVRYTDDISGSRQQAVSAGVDSSQGTVSGVYPCRGMNGMMG